MRFVILQYVHTVLHSTYNKAVTFSSLVMSGIDQRNAAINGDDVLLKQYIEARCNVCSSGKILSNFKWTMIMMMIMFVDYLPHINL